MVPRSLENWYSPGKIRKNWSVTEYTGQPLPAYGCNFVTAQPDAQLESMVIEWAIDEWPPKFTLFTKILQRIKDLNGYTLNWR